MDDITDFPPPLVFLELDLALALLRNVLVREIHDSRHRQ